MKDLIPSPLTFPPDSEFVALTKDDIPIGDPVGDESPAGTDIVGNAVFPAVYIAYDGDIIFFRMRVRGDPRSPAMTEFQNFAWGLLIDTNGDLTDGYEWDFAVEASGPLPDKLFLIENTIKNSPGTGFNDQPEGTGGGAPNFSQAIISFDIARAVLAADGSNFGGTPDWFIDWAIDKATLQAFLGPTILDTPLQMTFFTSANAQNFNKDLLCAPAQYLQCFSDPIVINDLLPGVRGVLTDKETGCPIGGANVCLYDETGVLIAHTVSSVSGQYRLVLDDDNVPATFQIVISAQGYLTLCQCTYVDIGNRTEILNIAMARDCIEDLKCGIAYAEEAIIEEKVRIYVALSQALLQKASLADAQRVVELLCRLGSCTKKLDYSAAAVLRAVGEVECREQCDTL